MASRGTVAANLAAHLANLPGQVGCRHLARQRDDFEAGILVSLGLVKPITSRVPRCAEHGCPLTGTCEHAGDFEPDASGNKAGVKYRPTAAGLAASADPSLIDAATRALPSVESVLALLADEPLTVFELDTRLRADRDAQAGVPDRPELGHIVALLVETGKVRSNGVMLTRV